MELVARPTERPAWPTEPVTPCCTLSSAVHSGTTVSFSSNISSWICYSKKIPASAASVYPFPTALSTESVQIILFWRPVDTGGRIRVVRVRTLVRGMAVARSPEPDWNWKTWNSSSFTQLGFMAAGV